MFTVVAIRVVIVGVSLYLSCQVECPFAKFALHVGAIALRMAGRSEIRWVALL